MPRHSDKCLLAEIESLGRLIERISENKKLQARLRAIAASISRTLRSRAERLAAARAECEARWAKRRAKKPLVDAAGAGLEL